MKRAKHLMSTDIICLHPEDSIFEAAKVFSQLDVHGLPVVKGGRKKLVGIVTVSDIIKFIDIKSDILPEIKGSGLTDLVLAIFKTLKSSEDFEKELDKISNTKIGDIMKKDIITIRKNTTFLEIARLMDKHHIHRLPVVSRNKLIGIVTGVDLMKVLLKPTERGKKDKISELRNKIKKNINDLS